MQVSLTGYAWGAGIATDLVNTSPWVWHGVDHLPDTEALDTFLGEHDLMPADGPSYTVTAADLDAVHRLRDATRGAIDDPDPERLVTAASALSTGIGTLTLVPDASGTPQWFARSREDAPLAEELALACAVGILGVVHSLGPERFRSCAAPDCRGAFIDTSRPGRRRYCMPDLCGNRVNVANHRARKGSTSPS